MEGHKSTEVNSDRFMVYKRNTVTW